MSTPHLHTVEAKERRSAAKAANRTSTPRTTRPGSETTTLTVGTPVRIRTAMAGRSDLSRYNGRNGWVAVLNPQTFPDGSTYVEIGVTWALCRDWGRAAADAWFRADEVVPA